VRLHGWENSSYLWPWKKKKDNICNLLSVRPHWAHGYMGGRIYISSPWGTSAATLSPPFNNYCDPQNLSGIRTRSRCMPQALCATSISADHARWCFGQFTSEGFPHVVRFVMSNASHKCSCERWNEGFIAASQRLLK
jgi:hypothetical protein